MRVRPITLKLFAASFWYVGGGVLAYRGASYLLGAMDVGTAWPPVIAGLAGVVVGLLRGRTLFLRANHRNLRRIEGLADPRAWQFFRPAFFAALVVMVAAGAFLAWLGRQGYWGGVVVGGLELTIATALLTSSVVFWTSEHGLTARARTRSG